MYFFKALLSEFIFTNYIFIIEKFIKHKMKTSYEISIVNNDVHKNECLSEIINNLEKLEVFADDIFNRINKKVNKPL